MATQSGQKILRVGVIQNDRVIEERIFRTRESVTIGQGFQNTLVVPLAEAPKSFTLFDVRGGKYYLCFTPEMSGRVASGASATSLAELRSSGKATVSGKAAMVELPENGRGKVTLGEVTFLFQFVNPPPLRVLPQLPANMRGGMLQFLSTIMGLSGAYLWALLFSFIVQFGAALYLVLLVPPPPRPRSIDEMSSRFVRAVELPEQQEQEPDESEPDDSAELVPEAAPEPEPTREREPEPEPSVERRPSETREEAMRVVEQTAIGAAFVADGGIDLGLSAVDRTGQRDLSEVLAGGNIGGSEPGLASNLGARPGIDPGQRPATGSNIDTSSTGPAVATGPADSGPSRPTGSIRAGGFETAGTGSLDRDNINGVLRRANRQIESCYQRALGNNPSLAGRMEVRFEIGGDGRVASVRIPSHNLGREVQSCIEGVFRGLRFRAPDGGSVWVQRPYVFSSGR
ncbi:MAG: hypothetical protein EA398_07960 [Deltaproteobacteria bacterium]|nr:MAG: hypothetical protein EA398_07960 [Deltaproteobacteria bacterium]